MRPVAQHVRRRLCTLAELRDDPGIESGERTSAIDWTIWNSIRPDPARDGSLAALLDLLSGAPPSEPAQEGSSFPTA